MRDKDVVSVIVPVYNTEKYLERCVKSIINQTYSKLQIILVNDGSTDKSGAVCDQLAELDRRISVYHKNWGGAADARNVGLAFATGEYVSFIDSDDYIHNTMYEEMVSSIKKYDCDIAVCGRYDVLKNRVIKSYCPKKAIVYEKTEALKEYFKQLYLESSCCDKLFRYSAIKGLFFPREKASEDFYFSYAAVVNAKRVVHIGKPMYYYCHRENSHSTKIPIDMTEFDTLYFIEKIERKIWSGKGIYSIKLLKEFYALYAIALITLYESVVRSAEVDKKFEVYKIYLKLKALIRIPFVMVNPCVISDRKKRFLNMIIRILW